MIETGVPMPESIRAKGRPRTSPLWEMAVGDSMFFPEVKNVASCREYAYAQLLAHKHGDRKFAGRKMDGGVRVWRIA